jgi:lysozyme
VVSLTAKAACVLAGAGVLAIGGWSYATAWRPSTERYPLQGIDLGETPPASVEWGSVRAAGADFAYLVATSGADRRDPAFEAHWAALPEAGLRRGAVHLYSLCQSGGAQANAFNTFVPRAADALPMAVEVAYRDDCAARPDTATLAGELRRFAAMVEGHTGKPVLLRVSRDVESDHALSTRIARPTWVMANFGRADYTAKPWAMWRASDVARIDGIEGPVNWDVVAP